MAKGQRLIIVGCGLKDLNAEAQRHRDKFLRVELLITNN